MRLGMHPDAPRNAPRCTKECTQMHQGMHPGAPRNAPRCNKLDALFFNAAGTLGSQI